jgi:septum formation protein
LKNLPPIILASASPRRSDLLRQLDVNFKVAPANVAEVQSDQLTPREICQINAYRKARALAKQNPDSLVLGADTLVCLDTQVFGKPANLAQAAQMLGQLQGKEHEVVTGVCLLYLRAHRQRLFVESTRVWFRPLNDSQIKDYLSHINPLDKAGAYGIQDHGELIVHEISGSFSNVVGLPLERLEEELKDF